MNYYDLSLYKKLLMSDAEIDNHESDLYVEATSQVLNIIAEHQSVMEDQKINRSLFMDQTSKKTFIDIPFAYEPFWNARKEDEDKKNVWTLNEYDRLGHFVKIQQTCKAETEEQARIYLGGDGHIGNSDEPTYKQSTVKVEGPYSKKEVSAAEHCSIEPSRVDENDILNYEIYENGSHAINFMIFAENMEHNYKGFDHDQIKEKFQDVFVNILDKYSDAPQNREEVIEYVKRNSEHLRTSDFVEDFVDPQNTTNMEMR